MKSETRNPKPEGNPNDEVRNQKVKLRRGRASASLAASESAVPSFRFRDSDLGFPSGFGFRISDFDKPETLLKPLIEP